MITSYLHTSPLFCNLPHSLILPAFSLLFLTFPGHYYNWCAEQHQHQDCVQTQWDTNGHQWLCRCWHHCQYGPVCLEKHHIDSWLVNICSYPPMRRWPPCCHYQNSQARLQVVMACPIPDNTELITGEITGGSIICHHTGPSNQQLQAWSLTPTKAITLRWPASIRIQHAGQEHSTPQITDTLVCSTAPAASLNVKYSA